MTRDRDEDERVFVRVQIDAVFAFPPGTPPPTWNFDLLCEAIEARQELGMTPPDCEMLPGARYKQVTSEPNCPTAYQGPGRKHRRRTPRLSKGTI